MPPMHSTFAAPARIPALATTTALSATPALPTTPALSTTAALPTTPALCTTPALPTIPALWMTAVEPSTAALWRTWSMAASLSRDPRRQAAGYHLRHAVARHGDPVEAVRRLHGALLVGDHDELRAVGEAAQDAEEAVDVEVVERGLDLVEDVERARPGEEDREQERERGQRLLTAGQQRQPLGRFAGGSDLDLHAEEVVRVRVP